MDEHYILVYRRNCVRDGCWVMDCEEHSISHHTYLFSDAVGRALMHKWAHR